MNRRSVPAQMFAGFNVYKHTTDPSRFVELDCPRCGRDLRWLVSDEQLEVPCNCDPDQVLADLREGRSWDFDGSHALAAQPPGSSQEGNGEPRRPLTQSELTEQQTKLEVARTLARRQAPLRIAAMDEVAFAAAGQGGEEDEVQQALLSRFTLLEADDLRDVPNVPDIVESLIAAPGTLNMISGYRGSMKTLTTLGLAAAVGGGLSEVYGLKVTLHAPVLFAYLEGSGGLPRRMRAWEVHHNRRMVGVHFFRESVNLRQPGDVRAVALLARQVGAQLIVLDSVAKTGGGREDAEDFSAYRLGMEALRDATGAAVLVLHNSGVGDKTRARGHTTLPDALDSAVNLAPQAERDGGGVMVKDEKSRDSKALKDMRLKFEPAGELNPATGESWSGVVVRQEIEESINTALASMNEFDEKATAAIRAAMPDGIAPKDLGLAVGVSDKTLASHMGRLVKEGTVIDNGRQTRGKRYLLAASD